MRVGDYDTRKTDGLCAITWKPHSFSVRLAKAKTPPGVEWLVCSQTPRNDDVFQNEKEG
jgi:hypothetical protein